jgi:arylsulfatase A-like enzyme
MNNLKFLSGIIAATALPLTFCSCTAKSEKKPNIIFLLTDDQRWDALGINGNKQINTPNIDNIASQGVVFNNAFVTTSICCTSRASILMGQYAKRHGINDFFTPLNPQQIHESYPLMLKEKAGYTIGFVGKYGIGNPNTFPDSLFDFWACEPLHQPKYENVDAQGNYIHYTDLVGQRIEHFLNTHDNESPFCLSVSFKAPHVEDNDPRQFIPNPRYNSLFADLVIPVPETAADSFWLKYPEEFRNNNIARERWHLRFATPEMYQQSVKNYYRLMKGVDDVVGKLMQQLHEMNIADNTILIFMGDNGFFLGEHGMAGKWYAYNESVRVPLWIYDPRYKSNHRRTNDIALNIDVAPTILEMAGLEVPASVQGKSLYPIVKGASPQWRTGFYYEHRLPNRQIPKSEAVITKQYKYIDYYELGYTEFYDLSVDSLETTNRINYPAYTAIIDDFKAQLQHYNNTLQ